jgi:type II restriction enzyme
MTQKQLFFSNLKFHLGERDMFTLKQVYLISEGPLSFHYPFNSHIRDKIRELLQVIRNEGHILFIKKGIYKWK